MHLKDAVKNSFLFSDLSPESLADLEKISIRRTFGKGEMPFHEDEPANSLFMLGSGSVNLVKSSAEGKEQLIRTVKPGEIFAEAALFSGENYPVTAIATAKSIVYSINKEKLLKFISKKPEVSLKMMGAMARLLRHLNSLIADLTLGSVSSRLAKFLLTKYNETGSKSFDLGMKKQDLAKKLGTAGETLSRNLSKFKDLSLIDIKGSYVVIKDLKGLKKYIEKE